MKLIKTEQTISKIETYSLDYNFKLQVFKKNDKIIKQDINLGDRKMYLVKDSFFEYIKTVNPFHTNEYSDTGNYLWWDKYIISDILNADINYNNIIELKSYDHTIRDYKNDIYSTVIKSQLYEISDRDYNLNKTLEYLKSSKYVLHKDELCIVDIPYYNTEVGFNKYIPISILLPQTLTNDIWLKANKESLKFKELILGYNMSKYDILGLNKFKKEA